MAPEQVERDHAAHRVAHQVGLGDLGVDHHVDDVVSHPVLAIGRTLVRLAALTVPATV
jgi:hypothetical protein